MATSVTKNISEINISQSTFTLTITNNNTGNSVTVQQQPIPTLSLQTPGPQGGRGLRGPQGDQGPPGSLESAGGLVVSGSVIVSGSGNVDFSLSEGGVTGSFTGSFTGDGSNLLGVISASYAVTASHAVSALTASFALNAGGGGLGFPFSGSAVITGSLQLSGSGNLTTTGLVSASKVRGITGSFSRLEGFSPIRIGEQVTFEDTSTFTSITASAEISSSGNIIAPNLLQDSSSFSSRVTANEIVIAKTLLSGSAQIATEISGAFSSASSSFSTRVTTLESNPVFTAVDISGSFTNVSESISSRLNINETNITNLTSNTSSYVLNAQTSSMSVFFATSASYAISSSVEITKELSSSHANVADVADALQNQPSIFVTSITASGGISSSNGIITAITGAFNHIITDSETIEFRSKGTKTRIGQLKFDPSEGLDIQNGDGSGRAKIRAARGEFLSLQAGAAGIQSLGDITASGNIRANGYISASTFSGDGSGLTNIPSTGIVGLDLDKITSGTATASISATDGFKVNTNSQITGSGGSEKYALRVSQSINAYNVNAGNPTSNNWQSNLEGSFFNNFTTQTDVSEILRFVAGLLSSSAPNPNPNTRLYETLSENKSNQTIGTITGYIPQGHDSYLQYLIDKSFAAVGGTIFPGKTVRKQSSYVISYTSNTTDSSNESSNESDTQLFGLGNLSSGGPTEFRVSGSHIFTYSDNNAGNSTENSSSAQILSISSFGTSNGLTLGKIETSNPSVIPAAFQDGKYATVFSSSPLKATTRTLTDISSSGTYTIETTVGIATGSQTDYATKSASETIFYAPIDNISSNIGSNDNITTTGDAVTPLTLTSQSLSGAPYVNGGTWQFDSTASGMFDPLYAANASLIQVLITSPTPGNVTVSRLSGFNGLSTSGGTIQTTGVVRDRVGAFRNNGVPHRQDSASFSTVYQISGTGDTINESGFADTNYSLQIRIKNKNSVNNNQIAKSVNIHTAGQFNQPVASGSMGYFGSTTNSSNLSETFVSESKRRVITSPTALTTQWNKLSRLVLGDSGDLQVKPGYLVNPESNFGYFYNTDNFSSNHYKWYLREFETGVLNNQGTLVIDTFPNSSADFVTFDSTTANKIAIGVIFEAQLPANSGNNSTIIFDAIKGNGSYAGTLNDQATSAQLNPFNANVDIQGDFSSFNNSNGTLTLGLTNPINQTINGSFSKVYLLIRYKGKPANTLESITLSTS